jgi:hypothetical protein
MEKQFQGSKKKARKAAFARRDFARKIKRKRLYDAKEALQHGSIKEMAAIMGIRLE